MVSSTAIFACSDVLATISHYLNVLAFESSWTWGDPPTFGSVSREGVTIMFNQQPDLAANASGLQHWINVDEVDVLYELHKSKRANIIAEIGDRPWGAREYTVQDLNGYHLRFAGVAKSHAKPSRAFPEGVTLERRKPTIEEHSLVANAAFGFRDPQTQLLDATWAGVVALDSDGNCVGVLRIMWDSCDWYSIWDVAVLPEWQGQRIGTKMMQEAMEVVRAASPQANIHLFTYQYPFYEKLGFHVERACLRRL